MMGDLFFIAVIIEGETGLELTRMKSLCAEKYDSKRALNSPPHITLIPPFRYDKRRIKEIEQAISQLLFSQTPFYLTLNGFGHFRKDVIFVKPGESEVLSKLYNHFSSEFNKRGLYEKTPGRNFHPHLTIAFRDLRADQYKLAWQYFESQDYLRVVEIKNVALLKHDGKRWQVSRKFPFDIVRS